MRIPVFAATLATLIPVLAFAHSGASGIILERMEAMKEIADSMKTIGGMLRGKLEFDNAAASQAAKTISSHAAKMTELFPENSGKHPSEALPAIWQNWDEFSQFAAALDTKSAELQLQAAAAGSVRDIASQFKSVAGTCSGCHEKFRLKK